jgi:3-methylfumaryl-CoA hydratase
MPPPELRNKGSGVTAANVTEWIGRTESVHDELAAAQTLAAAATFDDPILTEARPRAIPPLWHWFYFLPRASQSVLSADGHPMRGGFMPPIALPRRMFAGSRVTFHAPLRPSVVARRDGEIRNVVMKDGKSGALAFVTVGYRIWQGDTLCVEEEQDIVYREQGAPLSAPVVTAFSATPPDAWTRVVTPDSRLLFRFSALTFNAHRIHYDRAYATRDEGYPGLVVHGPLNAVLLANLIRAHTPRPITHFAFRGVAPVFDLAPFQLVAHCTGRDVACDVRGPDGAVALTATATLGDET